MPTPDPPDNGTPEPTPDPHGSPPSRSEPPQSQPPTGPSTASDPPEESGPHAQPWTWSVDPDPPTSEPTPDPEGGPFVDDPTPPPPVTAPPPPEPPARPPDWSTPDTPVVAPPIGGDFAPPPHPDQTSPYAEQPHPEAQPYPEQEYGEQQQYADEPYPDPPGAYWPDHAPWLDEPPGYVQPPPERRRRLWLLLGVSVALVLCCCAGVVGTALTWGGDLYAEVESRGQRIVGLNQPGRDGDLEFLVREVECGVGRVGDPLVNQLAVGQFCVVELAVRNVGKRPVFFTDTLQEAFGPGGEQFGADSGASVLANSDQQVFMNEINPGMKVTGAVVYDIPAGARIVRMRLHHMPSSPGLVVRVE
ncbi:DUF4352 domain-containing protein [Micromonospora sp. NBC_01796]|uniref:DUF4352 domain-containing protein n=1 Tax=Micromonospora sp. NBC_01796 TaxID=2975987 RepID=UPI002DDA1A5E|nr:DUF4352 domain-containing protein [Micromonospora sp. NBC_01796]WSA88215.1 DUF4352 domain-containing protein [Micromonospora sp. NBC_01796]